MAAAAPSKPMITLNMSMVALWLKCLIMKRLIRAMNDKNLRLIINVFLFANIRKIFEKIRFFLILFLNDVSDDEFVNPYRLSFVYCTFFRIFAAVHKKTYLYEIY